MQIAGLAAMIYHSKTGNENTRTAIIIFIMMAGLAAPLKLLDGKMREKQLNWFAGFCGLVVFFGYLLRLYSSFA